MERQQAPTGTPPAPTTTDAPLRTSIDQRMLAIQQTLRGEAGDLTRLAAALAPLTKPRTFEDLTKVPAILERVEKKLAAIPGADRRGGEILAEVRHALAERRDSMRQNLARELRAACEALGLGLRVVRREDPVEVRIPPLSVVIDREKGRADLRFARLSLATCGADPTAILQAHQRVVAAIEAGFDAEQFFSACHKAWLAARGAGEAGAGDRVEIIEFLPYLAMQMQKRAFRVEPSARNYRDYGRARFAYDMLQLRRHGGFARGGWRINLGVATGTTASKKNRVIWFEDEHGEGEFKLTVFFTRQEETE